MKPKKATKRPAVRMKPAMKAMKSMRMKPGDRAGNKYCRRIDGEVVEHRGSRYAPGSCRRRKYITKDDQIKNLRAQFEEELQIKRAEVEALTAKIVKLEKSKKNKDAIVTDPTGEYHRGRTYEWKRWMRFVEVGLGRPTLDLCSITS